MRIFLPSCDLKSRFVRSVRLVGLCAFLFLPIYTFAQADPDDIRNKLSVGSIEEKRNALFEIRLLHTEEASRLAMPALSDQSEIVRATAVTSVIFLPPSDAVKALLPILNDTAPFVRRETAFALGEVGDASANAGLIQDLQREKDVENRSAAAMALGKIGDPSAIEPLISILKKRHLEADEFVRASAARSIGEIAETMRFGKRQRNVPQNFLGEKYKVKFSSPTVSVTQSNRTLGSAIPVLSKVLENSRESDETRRGAAFAIGAIGDPSTIELLRSHTNSKDPYLAEICKEALLNMSPPN